jgi:hypothetical protein
MSRRRNPGARWAPRAGARSKWSDQQAARSNTGYNGRQQPLPLPIAEELARLFAQLHKVERLLRTWYPHELALPLGEVVPLSEVRWIKRGELLKLIEVIEKAAPPSLGKRSEAFLDGLRQLAAEYPTVRLSAKQSAWLDGLIEDAGIVDAS